MVGSVTAQIALLAFALAIVVGLYAGNSPATVLARALVAMVVALGVGTLAGWTIKLVLRDHLQCKKVAIDQAHVAPTSPPEPETKEPGKHTDAVETG